MVIVFLPALEGLRPQWREAAVGLGATTWQYWTQVAFPLLRPAFLGSMLLLFANAFAAYATAAALVSQGSPILPLLIRNSLTSEIVLGEKNFAYALALEMVVVVAVVMSLYAWLLKRTSRWLRDGHRGRQRRVAGAALAAAARLRRLLRRSRSSRCSTSAPRTWPPRSGPAPPGERSPRTRPMTDAITTSLLLALLTVVGMIVLLVPTMIWVRLRVPGATRLVEFLCLLPLTIPALVIVVGLKNVYSWVNYLIGDSALTLAFVYVVLVLPFAYRAIDSSLSSLDATTLAEAARSLGRELVHRDHPRDRARTCGPASWGRRSSLSRWCWGSTRSRR